MADTPDIVKCPACNQCCYAPLIKPQKINGITVYVCINCDMAALFNWDLPKPRICNSQNGICSCLNNYLLSKGILLPNGKIKSGYCHKCFKKLVPIGRSRKNGKHTHDDWNNRKYHKKCWKALQDSGSDSDSYSDTY